MVAPTMRCVVEVQEIGMCFLRRTVEDDELPVPQGKTLITFLRTR